jgi:hypothetical protein
MGGNIPKMRSLGQGKNAPTLGLCPTCKTCQGNRIPIVKVKERSGKVTCSPLATGNLDEVFVCWGRAGLEKVVVSSMLFGKQPLNLPFFPNIFLTTDMI